METYRSGHNELDSKSSCRVTGTRVRIPPSPLLSECRMPEFMQVFCFFMGEEADEFGITRYYTFSAGHSAASNFPTASKIERMVKKAFL